MGQGFQLVNFDKRVRITQGKFVESTGAELYDYLTKGRGFGGLLVADLAQVRKSLEEEARGPSMWDRYGKKPPPGYMRTLLPPMHLQTQSSLLQLIPAEIIDMVFLLLVHEYDQSPVRMVPLAMTCQRCYEIGVRHINQFLAATWCGDRIMVVGEGCEPVDKPSGMTWTHEERVEYGLDQEQPQPLDDIIWSTRGWKGPLHSEADVRGQLDWAACSFTTPPTRFIDVEPATPPTVRLWNLFRTKMYSGEFFRPDMIFNRKTPDVPPRDPTAVEFVLNHSKCEYVRWDKCQEIGNGLAWRTVEAKRDYLENVCPVVRPALCWSPHCPLYSEEYPLVNTMGRGDWAGDRISLQDMPKDEPMLGWKDRTTEFMALFADLMKVYGEVTADEGEDSGEE